MGFESVQELFMKAADRYGPRPAIESGERSVSYASLESRSNRLANFLRERGVRPGTPVALLLEDTVEMVTGMLAVLKVGGLFVPLDPELPLRRLAAMTAEVRPPWYLSETRSLGMIHAMSAAPGASPRVICVDGDGSAAALRLEEYSAFSDDTPVERRPDPDERCYVFFTSGSTGRSKGIVGRLKGIDHFVRWEIETFGLAAGPRVSQLTQPTFDAFLRDVFVPLCSGGTLCAPPERDDVLDARRLVAWLGRTRVQLIHLVPTLFRSILAGEPVAESFPELRHVLLSGETLLWNDVRRWQAIFGDRVQLANLYGPSETTMTKFFFVVEPGRDYPPAIPIGKPMRGAAAILVDGDRRPCGRGQVGEFLIRTPYRSHGYWNRPDLTDEVFIPNPFSKDPTDLVYCTGDLGRILPDGNFEFLGRKDQQVKIRGLRIELGEIEGLLRDHEAIADAAVIAREDDGGNRYLCAYVVSSEVLEPGELREFLAGELPDSMIPSFFVTLEELPRTLSGKVDRRALPVPSEAIARASGTFEPPRTPTEEMLADIWAKVLRLDRIGTRENFFHWGGHSLLATQMLVRVRKVFGVDLPLRSLFEGPTITEMATVLEGRMQEERGTAAPPLVRSSEGGEAPLSFAQQRLWFLHRLEPDSAVYNMPAVLRLGGVLDVSVLTASLNGIVQRHEALRTTFAEKDGRPVQVIHPEPEICRTVVDLSALAEREDQARRLASWEAGRPFDLARGPLVRTLLCRLTEADHLLVVNMHHIVSDGWSMGVTVRELMAFYRGEELPELAVQYADFAVWQRGWLRGETLEQEVAWWRRQLDGAPQVLELPTDRPRPSVQSHRGSALPVRLPPPLVRDLEVLSRQQGTTLFMTLLAAFQVLLSRITHQNDLLVGSPIANRNQVETEGLIGFFVNTLVLRGDLGDSPSFVELLGRVRERTLGAYAHQDVPFEKLVDELQPERNTSRSPLFQVMFILQNAPVEELVLPGLSLSFPEVKTETSKFDLTLSLVQSGEGWEAVLAYCTDLFDAVTMGRLGSHYERLLAQLGSYPQRPVGEASAISEAQRHQLVVEWNDTAPRKDGGRLRSLGEWFEAQAKRASEAVALLFEGRRNLSYGELDRRAHGLAHRLSRLGVGPEVTVGIAVDRPAEVVVGLLGILKAGGVYLPLDPSHPVERLAWMLEDARARVVLTWGRIGDLLTRRLEDATDPPRHVRLDEGPGSTHSAREDVEDIGVSMSPGNLAYVIYTSGSTGLPKAVAVTHAQVLPMLEWFLDNLRLGPNTRVLQNLSYCFDFGLFELVSTLLGGGTLHFMAAQEQREFARYPEFLDRHRVNTLHTTPALFQEILLSSRRLPSLEIVHLGGEAVSRELIRRTAEAVAPSCRLYNGYGPTETSVNTSIFPMTGPLFDRSFRGPTAPIGRVTARNCLYVVDSRFREIPAGVPGELAVGGAGVARGYLRRPHQTAVRFVPDSRSGQPGARLYRTGDLVCWQPEGQLEFLGRIDHQVKLRGLRVELGEIESLLDEHPAVSAAVVTARGQGLAAYVVPRRLPARKEEGDRTTAELRRHLEERLPHYMLPSVFFLLEELPLTPSGKVDRRALPAPGPVAEHAAMAALLIPRTPTEELLAGIWAEVLDRRASAIGMDDNFFAIGGHSLLATRVVSRIRQTFGVEVALRTLFENPTPTRLARQVETASRTLLPPVKPMSRHGDLPLSFAQERLWFLDRMTPGNPAYNIPLAMRMRGGLDVPVLAASLNGIVRRHEALRTTFAEKDGRPVQVIRPTSRVEPAVVDLSGLTDKRENEARRLSFREGRRPFDLGRGPLVRTFLCRLAPEDHLLAVHLHHVVSDGWSLGVTVRELMALYRGERLAELPVRYADFAIWQRSWLEGETLELEVEWWRRQLDGAPQALELPTDRPRPPIQSHRGNLLVFRLPPPLVRETEALSRKQGTTLFMTLLATFQVLLSRYAHQNDLMVGSPIANRNRVEIEDLIGCFINTLVLRGDLTGNPTFTDLLSRVREKTLGAYAHQDLPFEKLVDELKPERDPSRSPLFQEMFIVQNSPVEELELPGLSLSFPEVETGASQFDLSLSLSGSGVGALSYCSDLFDAVTMRRFWIHYERLLRELGKNPQRSVCEMSLINEAERHQLSREWNDTAVACPRDRNLAELFDSQAERTPDTVAVEFEEELLSYGELDARARESARQLRRVGVGPEVRVAISLERCPELVVGLLGILKAGAAYVPLDPSYPAQRLDFMLEDSVAAAMVGRAIKTLPTENQQPPPAPKAAAPENLAYVIYTSGSTGRPKGAMNTHRAICNRLFWMEETYRLMPADCVLQKTPISFDVSVWEFFWPLMGGARLVLSRPEGHKDSAYLVSLVAERKVTVLHFVPPMLDNFLREPELCACTSLRLVVASGETLLPEHERVFFERVRSSTELHNLYGPTEAAIEVTSHACTSNGTGANSVPIGRPVSNTQIHLLDLSLSRVPLGVPGHLHIGGIQLGRGYLGRPARSAESFVPDPFSGEPGQRLYQTGDLARHLPRGEIEFLSRIDHQVKVRGFRVELGEIEAALARHPLVRTAAVVAVEHRLVAWLVGRPKAESSLRSVELREFLRRTLPDHMIPSFFGFSEALPLLPNGKVDRQALSAAEILPIQKGRVAPRGPIEEILAQIWKDILDVEQVGSDDSFFDLGGHSLLAMRVISRLRQSLKVDLPLRTLFENPTLAQLARQIETASRTLLPPVRPVSRDEDLPMSFAQERLWFLDRMTPGNPAYNIPLAVRMKEVLDVPVLAASFDGIVRRHEALRTTFTEKDGYPVQVIHPAPDMVLTVADLSGLCRRGTEKESVEKRESEARRLALQESVRPFDLSRDLLVRGVLCRLAADDHLLVVNLHHIVSDGWSQGVMVRELMALFRGERLPELPVQYADFAVWQRSWLRGETLEQEVEWWRRQLSCAPQILNLSTDHPRPPVQSHRGNALSFRLPPPLVRVTGALSRQQGTTLFMTLLAAFQVLLSRLTHQDDLLVGSPVANRNQAETEDLIGFFVNTLVLRGELTGNPTFVDLLGRVRERSLGAYAHQDLPFEKLVDELQPERNTSRSPLFQVMFMLQNASVEELVLPGLSLSFPGVKTETSKFDLTLSLVQSGEGWEAALAYCTDLFDAVTMGRLGSHYERLLAQLGSYPQRPVGEASAISEAQKHQLVVEWNDTADVCHDDRSLTELFESQAWRTPDAVAAVVDEQHLSYRELNCRAEDLARRLRTLGVGPEVPVAVCPKDSTTRPVSLLGVLKAGGAYVPLDPTHPEERQLFMLRDSGASVVVSDHLQPVAGTDKLAHIVGTDSQRPRGPQSTAQTLPRGAAPGNLAYLIYTSGSTGRPKAVAVTHRSACALVRWSRQTFSPAEMGGVLAATSICFDLSVFEILVPLCVGGRVILADNVLELASLPARHRVSLINTVPSAMTELLHLWEIPPSVRTVNLAGEPLRRRLVREIAQLGTVGRVMNLYGPSEDTTYSTFVRVLVEEASQPTIGRPVTGTRAYLLDGLCRAVPVGVAGELFLAGEGLARGYWKRHRTTAERFLPDPFAGRPGRRLYRTGDLGRFRRDGELEFLGRIDHQVKVRGFRIELGEIESVLAEHPVVSAAVVAVQDQQLVAYVIYQHPPGGNKEGGQMAEAELRRYLRRRLPQYMLPSFFLFLEQLPLTHNGKVDRKALRAPTEGRRPEFENTYVAPGTALEIFLAGLWRQILDVKQVGVHDNFFGLRGNSINAAVLVNRLQQELGETVHVVTIFDAPTIAKLAAYLTDQHPQAVARRFGSEALGVKGRGVEEPAEGTWLETAATEHATIESLTTRGVDRLPLSFSQERLWILDQLEVDNVAYNIPCAVRLRGHLDRVALDRSFDEVVRRHASLRTTFTFEEDKPLQVIAPTAGRIWPWVDLSALPPSEREVEARKLAGEEAVETFDLTRGPLLRVMLVDLGDEEHRLLVTMHHIISDYSSIQVLVRDLATLYSAHVAGESSNLAPLPVQYADFSHWQRKYLESKVLDTQLNYWVRQLETAPVQEVLTDRLRPATRNFTGRSETRVLPTDLSRALRHLGSQEGVTLFMVLLATFSCLLRRHSGQNDLLIGCPVAGRNRTELENLIGCFLNTVVLRIRVPDQASFRTLLLQVRDTARAAYAHQDLPFERLLAALRLQRDLSRTPLFQVFFNMIVIPNTAVDIPGLRMEVLPQTAVDSKFDMTLYVNDKSHEDGGISLSLVYNPALFDAARMAELLAQYEFLLFQVATRPEGRIEDLSLRTPSAATVLPDPQEEQDASWVGAVHELVSLRAGHNPEKVAVVDPRRTWTYQHLEQNSDRLAAQLMANGIGNEQVVAVYAHRNAHLVTAVLGVLKAGAAILILDPAYPAGRLIEVLRLAQPRGWLRMSAAGPPPEELKACLDSLPECFQVLLPPESSAALHRPPELPAVAPDDLACLSFTSGSTGVPKGILGRHGPLSHFLPWQRERFDLGPSDRFSMLSAVSHDPLQRDVFTALCLGATLCIPDPRAMFTPGHLARWLNEQGVTVTHLTPAMGQVLAERSPDRPSASVPSLRWAFLVGDVLTRGDTERLRSLAPYLSCVNLYGSTETQRAVAYYSVPSSDAEVRAAGHVLPLGEGMKDVQLLILTSAGHLAGIGEVGEICVRSPHLARGYLGGETSNLKRFRKNPFRNTPSSVDRIYHTGDLGRYRPDGTVSFAGRADRQVKIRGFRVETGEIEARLSQLPGVEQATVLARELRGQEHQLVAYVKTRAGHSVVGGALRQYLSRELPSYMVPSAFAFVDTFPLTVTGKVDRNALLNLPLPDTATRSDRDRTLPRDRLERELLRIWEDLLGVSPLGIRDDFFELGGHSLLAVRLMARVETHLGRRLPLSVLFEGATVEFLGKALRRQSVPDSSVLVGLQRGGENGRPPFFCVHPVFGNVLCYRELARHLGPDQAFWGLQAPGTEGECEPLKDVEQMADRYLEAITDVQESGPYCIGGWSFGALVAFEMARKLCEKNEEVALLALFDPARHEDLGADETTALIRDVARRFPSHAIDVTGCSPEEKTERLGRLVREVGLVPPDFTSSQIRRLLRVYTNNLRAARRFKLRHYPGRIDLFQAEVICELSLKDPLAVWGPVAGGGIDVEKVPGDHRMMMTSPHVEVLAHQLRTALDRSMAVRGRGV